MMPDREKVIRIIDELIFEAQKEPTWKSENALRCLKKELLKEHLQIVQCKDCKKRYTVLCIQEEAGNINNQDNWYCADGERRDDDVRETTV